MTSARINWMAWAQLLRLPNVFTAVADPLAGWMLIGGGDQPWKLPVLVAASASLYAAGMVLNDCFDYATDCRERPERPLPRGLIDRRAAWGCGWAMLAAGLGLAALAGVVAFFIALFLAFLIVFYDGWARQFVLLGPLTMGACRFANFLLGMRALPERLWIAPVVLAMYVTVLSIVARWETHRPGVRRGVGWMLRGIIVLDAVLVLVFTGPQRDWLGAWVVVSLLVLVLVLSRNLEMT